MPMKKTIEIKKDEKGFGTLYVNDEPFLILGGELHNSSSSNLQYMEKQVWPRLKELNLNTVLLPVAWENIEKEEGVYDFSLLEELIFQARREKMKLILLWFGLWKNGESTYVPGWVKRDSGRFFRARYKGGELSQTISPLCKNAVKADARAFTVFMKKLKDIDAESQTVLMVQVENEIGFLKSDRDYSKEADVVVLAIGEHFLQSGEATSKGIIEIPKIQQELFEALSEVNSEIAVVLFNGRPLDIRILEERAKAILEVWMPGTMGGAAIVEVLRGAVSPAGKLPMSFPYCVSQVPVHYDEFPTGRRHHPGKDKDRYVSKYLDMPNKPLYSFGYGLTYTQFEISDLELSKTVMKPGESVTVSVKVKNTGDREGTETLQLYIHDIAGSVVRPVKQLKGFERVILNAGEEKEVCFTVDEKMLRFLRADNTFGSEPGKFEVFIGNSSEVEECKVFELLKG